MPLAGVTFTVCRDLQSTRLRKAFSIRSVLAVAVAWQRIDRHRAA
jgi:hypothetical protein